MEINLNGNMNAPMHVDDAFAGGMDVDMGGFDAFDDAFLDDAADNVIQRDNHVPPAQPAQSPRPLPVHEVREVYTTPYGRNAGAPVDDSKRPTRFERLATTYPLDDAAGEFGPFRSEKEWEFAEWGVKTLGHGEMNKLLDLDYVSDYSRVKGESNLPL